MQQLDVREDRLTWNQKKRRSEGTKFNRGKGEEESLDPQVN